MAGETIVYLTHTLKNRFHVIFHLFKRNDEGGFHWFSDDFADPQMSVRTSAMKRRDYNERQKTFSPLVILMLIILTFHSPGGATGIARSIPLAMQMAPALGVRWSQKGSMLYGMTSRFW